MVIAGLSDWKELARDHCALSDMVGQVNAFLSPMIFITFGQNLYQSCISVWFSIENVQNDCLVLKISAFSAPF